MTTARMRWPGLNRRNLRARGLLAYWPMWEGPGSGTIGDVVNPDPKVLRAALAGGMNPATAWKAGGPGGGYALDFSNDANAEVNVGLAPVLNLTGPITVIALVSVFGTSATNAVVTRSAYLFNSGYQLELRTDGVVRWLMPRSGQSDDYWDTAPGIAVAGSTHLYAASADGSVVNIYVDGMLKKTQATGYLPLDSSTREVGLGFNSSANLQSLDGLLHFAAIYNRGLAPSEVQHQFTHPNDLLTLRRRVFPAAVAGGASLVVQDSACIVESEAVALTQHHVLSVADSKCIVESEEPAVTQHHVLAVDNSACIVESETVALTQHQALTVADSKCVVQSEQPALTQHQTLTVADSVCLVTSGSPSLTQHQALSVANSKCLVTSDNVTFVSGGFAPYYYLTLAS